MITGASLGRGNQVSNAEKCEHFGKHRLSGFDHCQMFFSALTLEK